MMLADAQTLRSLRLRGLSGNHHWFNRDLRAINLKRLFFFWQKHNVTFQKNPIKTSNRPFFIFADKSSNRQIKPFVKRNWQVIKKNFQLLLQYIRYMNIKKVPKSTNFQPASVYSITRNCHNQNAIPPHRTADRKSSLQNRNCLGESHASRFGTDSPLNQLNVPNPNCSEIRKGSSKSIKISGSRWLENQKQMVEFILNLKAKKSSSKNRQESKNAQEFQLFNNDVDNQEFICTRMLTIKKIERHQKQAINCFYSKDYQKCFGELAKVQNLIKKEKLDLKQHQLYINYLYAEFYYKLQDSQKWKAYLHKAKSFVNRLTSHETSLMKEYILSVQALQICLFLREQQFQKVLKYTELLKKQGKTSSKVRRRIAQAQLAACRKLCRFKLALQLIDRQCQALQNDQELTEEKRQFEFAKLFQLKVEMTIEFVSEEKAIELIESVIGFGEVSTAEKSNFSFYNSKIYELFGELLKKDQSQQIKLVFFYQKWIENQSCKKTKLKIQLDLFKTYYNLGIYQRALELFDSISSESIVYLGPQYLYMYASIKHFNGELSEAVSIMSKIVDICQDDVSKGLYLFKILEFNLEELNEKLRGERQLLLQCFLKEVEHGNCSKVGDYYFQYLMRKGQTQKAKKLTSLLRKSEKVNISNFTQAITNRKRSFKM